MKDRNKTWGHPVDWILAALFVAWCVVLVFDLI
jgi:hypothetical protein